MYGTPMKHILIVLFVMLVPYRMLAQGGVLTSDDYDEEVRRAEQFQFSEEYASLMIMPLEAYPDAFSTLSDFNFSLICSIVIILTSYFVDEIFEFIFAF